MKALGKAPLNPEEVYFICPELAALYDDYKKCAARRCAACAAAPGKLKNCHACHFAHYCDRECQTMGWEEHKFVCKVMTADWRIYARVNLAHTFADAAPLLPLDTILAHLGGHRHVEAYTAAVHLHALSSRSVNIFLVLLQCSLISYEHEGPKNEIPESP